MPSVIVLPRDLLILWPSSPISNGVSVSNASGSAKTVSPPAYLRLKRRAMTRVCSTCGRLSLPIGTTLPRQNRMSAA